LPADWKEAARVWLNALADVSTKTADAKTVQVLENLRKVAAKD
jgi:hypothetical protein